MARLLILCAALLCAPALAQGDFITVASTTSTEQSGLFKHLLPIFTAKTGIGVRVVAVGTGQALDIGRRGDADVVLVHDPQAERKFIEEGSGTRHRRVMYNDFVLVGPRGDPAGAAGKDIAAAFRRIFETSAPFVSRGDKSGTHAAELRLWRLAGAELPAQKGPWYRETGAGMGPALNTASALGAYILADRATWLAFRNRGDLALLVQGDERLFNQYGVMLVSSRKHMHIKTRLARAFIDWLVSPEGQSAIAGYRIGGEQLFFPNAQARNSSFVPARVITVASTSNNPF